MSNVKESTVERNLCVACGICKAVCPHQAIEYVREGGVYIPRINENCTQCGLCVKACPGVTSDYPALYENAGESMPEHMMVGNVKACYISKTRNRDVLQNATSGGIVTTLIEEGLRTKLYDSAFCVDSYAYSEQLTTSRYVAGDDFRNTQKSRYVPVSHENLIRYMRSHPTEKIIITATSCAMQGVLKAIGLYKLNRQNYLFIGLFCDRVLSYHVWDYFKDKVNAQIKKFYFRDKEAGGWPGNVSLVLANDKRMELPAKSRMEIKKYFQLERCLYCIDKLNQFADISVGDNYTGIDKNVDGNSCVIIRTNRGEAVWEACNVLLDSEKISIDDITASQHIDNRDENLMLSLNYDNKYGHRINILSEERKKMLSEEVYEARLADIALGTAYPETAQTLQQKLKKQQRQKRFSNNVIKVRMVLGKIKRKLWFDF